MKYASLAEYKALAAGHARFRRTTAGAVERANSGQHASEDLLGANSEFATSSRKLVTAIGAVQKRMARNSGRLRSAAPRSYMPVAGLEKR